MDKGAEDTEIVERVALALCGEGADRISPTALIIGNQGTLTGPSAPQWQHAYNLERARRAITAVRKWDAEREVEIAGEIARIFGETD